MPANNQQTPSPIYYQNDQWTLGDELGLGNVGDQVARMVLEVTPPFTIGVTGKWGAGKTSIMRRAYTTLGGLPLQQELDFSEPVLESAQSDELIFSQRKRKIELGWGNLTEVAKKSRCVWFSPWQHQNEDNPLIPLLLEIQSQFSVWTRFKQGSKKLNRRGGLTAMTLIERLIDGAATLVRGKNMKIAQGTTDAVRKSWNEAEPDVTKTSDGQRFHLLFEDAVNAILTAEQPNPAAAENARLVIFIDDLDRCEESVIVRLLEVIKLYLSTERCVFVLGLDDTAVMDALKRFWTRSDDLNREYLEKLFQARVPVPLPKTKSIKSTVASQLKGHNIPFYNYIAVDIELLIEPNPRKIKNFVNGLCVAWQIIGAKDFVKTRNECRLFVMYQYLQQYHHSVWRVLERQPKAFFYFWEVVTRANAADVVAKRPKGLDPKSQDLLKEMFRRAFSHVLENTADPETNKHGSEDIEQAVENFLHRLDRKRSDEYLCKILRKLVDAESAVLDPRYLYAQSQSQE